MNPAAQRRLPFAAILLLVVVAGYGAGKDVAMRANAQDRMEAVAVG